MARKRNNDSKAIKYKGFITLPQVLLRSWRFVNLHPRSLKLLLDIAVQYNGFNNGDLQATISCLASRGWTSRAQLTAATRELLDKQLIVRTRLGGFRMGCSLYALSWQPIDECGGKLDVASTRSSPVNWLKEEDEMYKIGQLFSRTHQPVKPKLPKK